MTRSCVGYIAPSGLCSDAFTGYPAFRFAPCGAAGMPPLRGWEHALVVGSELPRPGPLGHYIGRNGTGEFGRLLALRTSKGSRCFGGWDRSEMQYAGQLAQLVSALP